MLEWELTDYTSNCASPRRACWGGGQGGACSVDFLFYFEDKNNFFFSFQKNFFRGKVSKSRVMVKKRVQKRGRPGHSRSTVMYFDHVPQKKMAAPLFRVL